MSVTASYLILAIIIIRLLLDKAPKKIICFLWMLVGIRLIFPISFESVLSLVPTTEVVSSNILFTTTPAINSGLSSVDHSVNSALIRYGATDISSVNPMQIYMGVAAIVWLVGILCLLTYSVITYINLRKLVADAIPYKENVLQCDYIASPFILGIIKPKIYIPYGMEKEYKSIIAHEKAHIKRRDHWIKPLGFLLLSVYWFNPLSWVAYMLLCRDIELACDEKVMEKMKVNDRLIYSEALLKCAVKRKTIAMCPLAFGELEVNQRVKNILNYKKPAFWVTTVAIFSCIIIAICFLTSPMRASTVLEEEVHETILTNTKNPFNNYDFATEAHHTFGISRKGDRVTVYAMVLSEEYSINENGILIKEEASHCATAMTFTGNDNKGYSLVEYWIPKDGSDYLTSIYDKFPMYMWSRAVDTEQYIIINQQKCDKAVNAWFNETIGITPMIQELYDSRNPYIGDHIEDGKLLELLNVKEVGEFTMELETSKRPYVLRICFKDRPKDETLLYNKMSEKASYLLALIDNVDEIQWQYSIGTGLSIYYYSIDHANQDVGSDIKSYGKSVVELQKLYNLFQEKADSSPVNDVTIYYDVSS